MTRSVTKRDALAKAAVAVVFAGARGAALAGYAMITEAGKEITWGELHVGALSVYEDGELAHGQPAVLAAGRHADRV